MAAGNYSYELTVSATGVINSPQIISVFLRVVDPLEVPGEFSTIQGAIDAAVDGDTVIVADGTYTGEGNRDLDFSGKAITVRSENGAENCIINCEGTEAEYHRGFNFINGEDAVSVLDSFTIING